MVSLDVLIVEDDDLYSEIIERLISPLRSHFGKCTIRKVSTMEDALKEIRKEPPYDIVLLDLMLPDSTIEETIGQLQDMENRSAVVIVTGHPLAKAKLQGLNREYIAVDKHNGSGLGDLIISSIVRAITSWRWNKTERDINRLHEILELLHDKPERAHV